jgi:brefeldin A-resistance guanine nucleotide exchange factor 1
MVQVADTVTHCRFEATDPESDDVVLMKILRVLLACLVCPAGHLLTDDLVWSMLQTCFRMSIQSRLGGKFKCRKKNNG